MTKVTESFHQLFAPSPFIIDGGLATQLEAQGHDLNHQLWSAKLLLEDPQAIIDAHLAYLDAGAQCLISASYQATIEGFTSLGLSNKAAADAIVLSVELARQAVNTFKQANTTANDTKPLVAASVGPYGAYLANGAEYTGDYQVSDQVLKQFHQTRLQLLSTTSADLLACETVPSLQEAKVLSQLIANQDKPAWISFSCQNGQQLSDGHLLSEAAQMLNDNAKIVAIGVNCTAPQYINDLVKELNQHTNKKIIVYPNSGECFDARSKTWHGTAEPNECAQAAKLWHQQGASIIGGCCRMGPEHIRAMITALTP